MTVPGGVISLPQGASTEETLAFNLQNMSGAAMKARAVDRFPDIMNNSTGGNPVSDLTPLGILTSIWAGTNSLVAQADPADITGPEDLPGLLLDFIEGLPVIGQLVGLVEAIVGTYDGDDSVLLTIQSIFDPIRKLMQMITGIFTGFPSVEQVQIGFPDFIKKPLSDLVEILVNVLDSIPIIGPPVGNALEDLASIFGLLNDKSNAAQSTGENAQSSADVANVRISQLAGELASGGIPGGLYFTDTFARTGPNLGPDYTQSNTGPAGGTLYPDGNNASVIPSGAGITDCIAQINSVTIGDYQTMSVVQNSAIRNILVSPLFRLFLRENAARTESVYLTVALNAVYLEKKVGGSSSTIASLGGHPNGDGDLWTLKAGTDNDIRELVVIHNTAEVFRIIDTTGTPHVVGASNRYGSFSLQTGQSYTPPFFTNVEPPSALQSITFYDRLAAA